MSRLLALCTLLLSLLSSPAYAGQCPNFPGANHLVGEADAQLRLDYIHETAIRARKHARAWTLGWGLGFTGLTIAQGVAVPLLKNPADQRTMIVGAGSTVLGAVFIAAAPPAAPRHLREFEELRARGAVEECELLALAEGWLDSDSKFEKFGTGWLTHLGNLFLNSAAGLILGLGWDQWRDAWLTTAVGTLVGEIMIFTQPLDRTKDREVYLRGTWLEPERTGFYLTPAPMLVRGGGGLVLHARW